MDKRYSVLTGGWSRMHPIALIALIAFIVMFLTNGIFRIIASTIFLIAAIILVGAIIYFDIYLRYFKKE